MDSNGKAAGKGALIQTELSGTLGTSQDQTLFQPDNKLVVENKVSLGLDRASYNQGKNAQFNFSVLEEESPTVISKGPGADCTGAEEKSNYIVRRLTPTECARLQGFPDFWGKLHQKEDMTDDEVEFWNDVYITHQRVVNGKEVKPMAKDKLIKWYNKLGNDSNEYKMWGNGIALPCASFVMNGLAEHGVKTMASLFDGSGGFPLAAQMEGIEPVWSSEIEPYPIAVTVERFGDK